MKHCAEKIAAYLDGELSARQAQDVQAHCAACVECGSILEETRALFRTLAHSPAPSLPAPLWSSLRERLPSRERQRGRFSFTATAAAAALAGLALGFWMGPSPGTDVSLVSRSTLSLLEEGASLVEGAEWTLDQVYLAMAQNDEEAQP